MSIIIYEAERERVHRDGGITEECFQRGIRRVIYTKISVILPGTKAALLHTSSKWSLGDAQAKIYVSHRAPGFRFRRGVRGRREKIKREEGRAGRISSARGNAGYVRADRRSDKKRTPSSLCASCKIHGVVVDDETRARAREVH